MNIQNLQHTLRKPLKNQWALSTVVTTLIILVISVLLASVVTYFAINVTSTRVQEESLALAKQHVWYDSSNQKAQAAIMIINAGGRDIVIDRLTVRGQECAWSKVLFFVTGESVSGDLFYNTTLIDGGSISVGGSSRVFKQATTDLTLQSGKTLIIYMSNPDSISVNDIGLTVSINIFTSQAMYYKETNVQGSSGTTTTSTESTSTPDNSGNSTVEIQYASAYYNSTGDDQVALVITNTGSSIVLFNVNGLYIDGTSTTSWIYYSDENSAYTSDLPYYIGQQIQDQTLTESGSTLTISGGSSKIVYFSDDAFFTSSGTTIEVKLEEISGVGTTLFTNTISITINAVG
jgi:hypothetical protein